MKLPTIFGFRSNQVRDLSRNNILVLRQEGMMSFTRCILSIVFIPILKHRKSFNSTAPLLFSEYWNSYPHGMGTIKVKQRNRGRESKDTKTKKQAAASLCTLFHSEKPEKSLRSLPRSFHINCHQLERHYFNDRNLSIKNVHGALWKYPGEWNSLCPINSMSKNLSFGYVCPCMQRITYAQWYPLFFFY